MYSKMRLVYVFYTIFILVSLNALNYSHADNCTKWFEKSKLKPSPNCEMDCLLLPVDMGSSTCHNQCQALCNKKSVSETLLGSLLYYPGLNSKERELVEAYPKQALSVFNAKNTAENATANKFNRNDQDDESDAFRHFVWAANLHNEVGPDLAKKFLDAHESNDLDSNPSKAMDLANNRAGLLAAERLQKLNKLNEDEIERAAMQELKDKSLIVIRPKGLPK